MTDDKRWLHHPIRDLLSTASGGGHIYDDQIADLRLPEKVEKAFRQAAAQLRQRAANGEQINGWLGEGSPDHYARELVAALPDEHETRLQHEERRAQEGDAQALANIKAREDANDRLVDEVMNRSKGAA